VAAANDHDVENVLGHPVEVLPLVQRDIIPREAGGGAKFKQWCMTP
jgi:hypothetical protein